MVEGSAGEVRGRSEQFEEFFLAQTGLLEDAVLQKCRRNVFVMHWNGYTELRPRPMEKPCVASALMVNVETGALKRGDYLSRF